MSTKKASPNPCGCDGWPCRHWQEILDGKWEPGGEKYEDASRQAKCSWCGEPGDDGEQGPLVFQPGDGTWMHKDCAESEQHGGLATVLRNN